MFKLLLLLGLCFFLIIIGVLVGVVVILFIFGEVYVMILVLSVSIIGILVDYIFYYLIDCMVYGG